MTDERLYAAFGPDGVLHKIDPPQEQPGFAEWVILELLGHRRLAGHLTEQQIAGASFLRLEVPGTEDQPGATQLYSPGSVYCITPTTEEIARRVAARSW